MSLPGGAAAWAPSVSGLAPSTASPTPAATAIRPARSSAHLNVTRVMTTPVVTRGDPTRPQVECKWTVTPAPSLRGHTGVTVRGKLDACGAFRAVERRWGPVDQDEPPRAQ